MINKIVSITEIQYIFITSRKSYTDDDFTNQSFALLRTLPADLRQLTSILNHYEFSKKLLINSGVGIYTMFEEIFNENMDSISEIFNSYYNAYNNSLIKVFIIDAEIQLHENVSKFLTTFDYGYYSIINSTDKILSYYNANKHFLSPSSFLDLLKKDWTEIIFFIKKKYPEIEFQWKINDNKTFFNENPPYESLYTHTNYCILNQIIGNHWIESKYEIKDESYGAKKRIEYILKQVKVIDSFTSFMVQHNLLKPVDGLESFFSPLILIAPFHFPQKKKSKRQKSKRRIRVSKEEKTALKISKIEQEKDYTFLVDENDLRQIGQNGIGYILLNLNKRLSFLDYAGYLHASFTYSPVIRLPLVGKSINMQLSHLTKRYRNVELKNNKISEFGKQLAEKILDNRFKDYISNRNGQIVILSDLPIEWMYIDDYPLCYTHDVCRMPTYNQNGIINNYIYNKRFNFVINNDIVEKTLVVHCASSTDTSMLKMFQLIDNYKDEFAFKSVYCSSVDEIKKAVQLYKPELLIFDCHGNFDNDSLSSYLVIDGKKKIYLTGDDIIANQISAPLVFLSACSTMPNYGYVKFLSDAFMQVGAFSVTATFLPISVADGAVLVIRLLSKLNELKKGIIHSNWLEFMSHLLRTIKIHETIKKLRLENSNFNLPEVREIAEILTKTMFFKQRKEALDELVKLLKKNNPDIIIDFDSLNNEWLHYTTLGRADLLYFENWISEKREKNSKDILVDL